MTADRLAFLIDAAGYVPQSYSGRGMYGAQCVGVTVENVFAFIADLIESVENEDEVQEIAHIIRKIETDSMGKDDVIVYWSRLKWRIGMGESDQD